MDSQQGNDGDLTNLTLFIANAILFVLYLVPASFVLKTFRFKLDRSVLINIAIYTLSFLTRAVMWGLAAFYNNYKNKNDKSDIYRGVMIILEYFGAFVLEISIYFFVFEMMSVQSILVSGTHEQNSKKQRDIARYRWVAIALQSVAFAGLLFFYFDWNILNQRYSKKTEFNFTFQAFKMLSFMMDTLVLMLFWSLFRFFVNVKIQQRARNMGLNDFSGLSRKQKAIIIWIIWIMIVNVFYLLFKCFIRALSNLTEIEPTRDQDIFEKIHQNRFLVFSLVDLLNGLSVLYCFFCVADLSTNHKH